MGGTTIASHGDLAVDTALTPLAEGTFTATLSRDWEIWGPNGGYMAAFALGAAREASQRARPANATVHFLGVASFDAPIERGDLVASGISHLLCRRIG